MDEVTLHGRIPIEQVPAAIARADIGLAPTRHDVFTDASISTKIFEYGAMNKPVVASRLPLVEETFPPGSVSTYLPGDPAALPYATRALESEPEDPTYAQTKACVLLHLDRAAEAMPLLERVERARPDHFEAQYNLACGLAKTGEIERAIEHVRRAIERVPARNRAAFLAHVPNDPDLAALRGHRDFDELTASNRPR